MSQVTPGGNAAPPPEPHAPAPAERSMLEAARVPLPVLRDARACVAAILRRAETAGDGDRDALVRLLGAVDAALLAGEVIARGKGLVSFTDWAQRLPILARRVGDDGRIDPHERAELATAITRVGGKFAVLAGRCENDRTPPGYTPADVAGAIANANGAAAVTSRSCSWCHHLNRAGVEFCAKCGHKAHVARMDCDCPKCKKTEGWGKGGPQL